MENMNTIIKVKTISDPKKSKHGKSFWSIETDKGFFTCWDALMIEALKKFENNKDIVNVTYIEKDNFKTLKTIEVFDMKPLEKDKFSEAREEKNKSMYVAYCTQVFNQLVTDTRTAEKSATEIMTLSIELVKQAIGAFE